MNNEFSPHVKRNRDRLQPILCLAKDNPKYRDKLKLEGDNLVIQGLRCAVNDIHKLPMDLAAYQSAQKEDDQYLAFHGEWSPFSNFHTSPFSVDGKQYHSSEQWIHEQKSLLFNNIETAKQILDASTPYECKKLGYQVQGFDMA